ncbi:MAG TPA: hypothetical protein VL361_20225 [Candidatus Limnocylindrales bacterium]|nr:hypothetical protein [Candidatus Limnocylindrales bacterium]
MKSKFLLVAVFILASHIQAAPASGEIDPSARTQTEHTLFVSKLGDNSDGSSWAKAFRTIQAALDAVPDAEGAHRIIVRPDTYMEANLYPAHKGAASAYNELIGDFNGALGSGTRGWVVIDSGDPNKGFKSYDWWGPIRAYKKGWSKEHQAETFSAVVWDRWTLRHLYVTGGDGGLFFDLVDKAEPFSVRVEDCFSIGRAFGGGAANILSRPGEPSVFRRCQLWCLDWWGDAAGAYVRAEHPTPPENPDVVFDDCTLVGPDNALQAGNPGYSGYTRVHLKNCRLVSLNFSQPQGKPSSGVIFSTIEGELLHVDLEDCTLMGCKIFGAGSGEVSYATKGDVKAYVQFQQSVPKGMLMLDHWPVEVFQTLLPTPPKAARQAELRVDQRDLGEICEAAPVVWKNRLALMKCNRPASGGSSHDYTLSLDDVENGRELTRFAEGYGLACGLINKGVFYAFASRWAPDGWNDVTLFKSKDLKTWTQKKVISQEQEHLFNSSVCRGDGRFVMAYESDDPKYVPFTIKFATSSDLENWTKVPNTVFGGDRYAACPCIRFANGYYYLLYLEHRTPRWFFETYIARSKDLMSWEVSSANPVQSAGPNDGINASDPDVIEFHGQTLLYYSVGDQRTWSKLKRAVYPESLPKFLARFFEK